MKRNQDPEGESGKIINRQGTNMAGRTTSCTSNLEVSFYMIIMLRGFYPATLLM